MKSTDRIPANSASQTSLCCRYSQSEFLFTHNWLHGLDTLSVCPCPSAVFADHSFVICCVCSQSDAISTRVQDPLAEPPLQVFSAREGRRVERILRVPVQSFIGAEDKQEAG